MSAEGHCFLLVEDNGITSSAKKKRENPKASKHDTIGHSAASGNAVCVENARNRIVDWGNFGAVHPEQGQVSVLEIPTKILL